MSEKLIIESEGVRRNVPVPFNVCGSRKMLAALAEQIQWQLGESEMRYGWLTIWPPPEQGPAATSPREWSEP